MTVEQGAAGNSRRPFHFRRRVSHSRSVVAQLFTLSALTGPGSGRLVGRQALHLRTCGQELQAKAQMGF